MADTAQLSSDTPEPVAPRRRSGWRFILELVVIVIIALLVAVVIKSFLIRSFYIPSASMENTLMGGPGAPDNDRIIVNELVPRFFPLQHGDVVVFSDPGGWLENDPGVTGNDLVKRVIGLPGDHVVCCNADDEVTVNGHALKEPYVHLIDPNGIPAAQTFNVVVPKGELWVMGDNRQNSKDSSANQSLPGKGFVPEKDVVGRAVVISWPISRWTWLSNYPSVFRSVGSGK